MASRTLFAGGYQVCDGLVDVKPEKFGLVDNVVTQASKFGDRREVYDGVDATISGRFAGGTLPGRRERRAHLDPVRPGRCANPVLRERTAVLQPGVQILCLLSAALGRPGERRVPEPPASRSMPTTARATTRLPPRWAAICRPVGTASRATPPCS